MFAFLYLLIAFGIVLVLDETGALAAEFRSLEHTLLGTAGVCATIWLASLAQIRLLYRAIQRNLWRTVSLLSVGFAALQLGAFTGILLWFHWGGMLDAAALGGGWTLLNIPVVGELLALAPALILAAIGIVSRYRLDATLRPQVWTRGSHFAFYFRWVIAPLPLLILIRLVDHGVGWVFEEPALGLWVYPRTLPALGILLEFVPLLVVLALFPFLLRFVFPTSPLPSAWLRARLRALDERVGVKVREVRIWHTGRARVPNALVTGFFGRSRYVFLSDAMLANFTLDELEAVYCHELGHVRHRHLLMYIAVILGLILFTVALLEPSMLIAGAALGMSTASIEVAQLSFVSLLLLGVLFLLLTVVSRINERQADLAGTRFAPNPFGLVLALERINQMMGGGLRNRPSPTHGSIAMRTDFILAVLRDPRLARTFLRKARRVHTALVALAFAGMASLLIPVSEQVRHFPAMRALFAAIPEEMLFEERRYLPEEIVTVRERLDEVGQRFEDNPRVYYFQAALTEMHARALENATAEQMELAREAVQYYERTLEEATLGFPSAYRFNAMRSVEQLEAALRATSAD